MPGPDAKPSLFEELKRRNVFRAAAMYAVVAWVLIQIGEATFDALGLPEGSLRFLIIAVAVGFPVALVVGWLFDWTSEGLIRTSEDPEQEVVRLLGRRRIDYAIIGALGLALAMALFGPEVGSPAGEPAPIRSIAVIPLEDLSASGTGEYFADGMTEALISNLARIDTLKVISRTSVMRYKRTVLPVPQIALELGVDALLEGTVVRDGDRVRVTAQLIDGRTDHHLWAEQYERDLRDILSLQREIASAVAAEVEAQLSPFARAALDVRPPVVPEALEAYLKARYFAGRYTPAASLRSRRHYEDAMRIDPDFPLPYAGLADNLSCAPLHTWAVPAAGADRVPTAVMDLALELASRAEELDPTLPESQVALGLVRMFRDWNWEEALHRIERGLARNPSFEMGHRAKALVLVHLRRFDEAKASVDRSLDLDPLNPMGVSTAGDIYEWMGDTDRAIELWEEATALDASHPLGLQGMGVARCRAGRVDLGVALLEQARRTSEDDPLVAGDLGHCLASAGRTEPARLILAELQQRSGAEWVSPVALARIHLGLGELELAVDELERAFRIRAYRILQIGLDRRWDPVRDDPRFQAILEGMGLAD